MSVLQKTQLHNPLQSLLVLVRNRKLQLRKFPAILSLFAKMKLYAGTKIRRSFFCEKHAQEGAEPIQKRSKKWSNLFSCINFSFSADKHNVCRLFYAWGVLPLGDFFFLKCRRFCIDLYVFRLILSCYGFFFYSTK